MRKKKPSISHECDYCGRVEAAMSLEISSFIGCDWCSRGAMVLRRNGKELPHSGGHILLKRVKGLGTRKRLRYGIWTSRKSESGLLVYMRCVACGGVNEITDCEIGPKGYVGCFHCVWCHGDHYVRLEGWTSDLCEALSTERPYRRTTVVRGRWLNPTGSRM